jgi:hypothetical protein
MSEEVLRNDWVDMALGPLPVGAILQCLGIELPPGEVMFYAHAQKHTFDGKPERHVCLPHLKATVAAPSYVGQQPDHKFKGFDLVYSCPEGLIVLVAIGLKIRRGVYPAKSTYPLKRDALLRRVRVGTTVQVR